MERSAYPPKKESRMKIAAIRIALSFSCSCLLVTAAPQASRVEASRSKQPLSISFEAGRFEPDPSCRKGVQFCPKVFVPAREFKAGSAIWVKATAVNYSKLTACFGQNNFLIHVFDSATGAEPKLVQHDGIPMITATPPDVNYCIAPKQTSSELFREATAKYVLTDPGTYMASAFVPDIGLTKAENLMSEPMNIDSYRDAKAVKHIGKIESETGQFVIVQ
jgi:hypothetical protein